MQSTSERRQAILEYMCERRHESVENLMFEFQVSRSTILRDLQVLSCSYPIYTTQGNGGGVHVVDGYRLGKKYLTSKQKTVLEKYAAKSSGEDFKILKSILASFSAPGRND